MKYNIKVGEKWLIGESATETIKGTVRGDTTAVFSRMVGEMSAYDFADNRQEAASFDRITLCDYLRGIVERQNYGHYLGEIKVISEDEVEAQLPKRGEWQKAKPKGVVTYSDGYAECSHCHETIWLGWWMNFCPHCGTQNKIIDPDDYDWAKMNESNASNASNELNALDNAQDGPIITPCRGCSDYDGYGGCKSKGECARAKMEVQDEA